eukprot:tig00021373_g21070.t1
MYTTIKDISNPISPSLGASAGVDIAAVVLNFIAAIVAFTFRRSDTGRDHGKAPPAPAANPYGYKQPPATAPPVQVTKCVRMPLRI